MAKNISNLAIKLSASSASLRGDLNQAAGQVQGFAGRIRSAGSSMRAAFAGVSIAIAAIGAGGSLGSFVGWGVKLAADAETAEVAFATMLKSADAAKAVLGDLRKFAAATPFEFPELRDAARSLLAFGVKTSELIPTLRAVGDVASGINAPIGEIAEIYGKARVQGRLFMEDINQLTGRGILIIQELAKQFGVAESEVRKLVESGKVNFSNLKTAFESLTTGSGQFAGMMEKQSQTLSGRWSTLKDVFGEIALSVGTALKPALDDIVTSAAGLADSIKVFLSDSENLKRVQQLFRDVAKTITDVIDFVSLLITKFDELSDKIDTSGFWMILRASMGPSAMAGVARDALMGAAGFDRVTASAKQASSAVEEVAAAAKSTAAASKTMSSELGDFARIVAAMRIAEQLKAKAAEVGKSLKDELQTPVEKIAERFREIQQAARLGGVDQDLLGRAREKYSKDLSEALAQQAGLNQRQQDSGVGAAIRGTTGAFSAVQAAGREQREIVRRQQEQIKIQQRANEILQRIATQTEEPIRFNKVDF